VENYSNYRKIDAGNTTLAGYPAYKIIYTDRVSNFTTTEIWTVKEGKVYTINHAAHTRTTTLTHPLLRK